MGDGRELLALVNGYQVSQAIHAAVALGVPDALAGGPSRLDELDVDADPDALGRLLRALAAAGVVRLEDDRYALTELGEGLRSDVPGSLAGWAGLIGRPYYWNAWSGLLHSVRTGENAFRAAHGESIWDYRSTRPEEQAIFDRAMTSLSGRLLAAVVDAHDWGRYGTVVDVGGGRGALLTAILDRHPGVRGIVFDQPAVVAAAPPHERLETAGGDFFAGVPAGGDAYILKAVIHDWEDAEAVAILRACHDAGAPEVLLVERDLAADRAAPFSDLNMLVAPGGRERTLDEYGALLTAAGFTLTGSATTPLGTAVIRAVAA